MSLDCIREMHATLRCTGDLDGVAVSFRVVPVPGDGDCGYTVVGVSREDAANALLEHLHDGEIRRMIGMEIRSMLLDDALPLSVRDAVIDRLLKERIVCRAKWTRAAEPT